MEKMTTNWEQYNKESQQQYTSTGDKILCHKDAVADLAAGRNHPITLHIMPTEVCNLRCVFCSVAERGNEDKWLPDLKFEQMEHVVETLVPMGLKAVILSGGGEPTLYKGLQSLVWYLRGKNLELGMITNGIPLHRVPPAVLEQFTWIRISANSYDYVKEMAIPKVGEKTTLGFSYVMNPLTTEDILTKVWKVAMEHKIKYVRLLPDCNLPTDKLETEHAHLHNLAERMGPPFFHQYKTHRQPDECHLGRVHPVLYTDGWIYPCDSVVLNSPPDDKRFHPEYAMCRWDEVESFFRSPISGSLVKPNICPKCVFFRQNEILWHLTRGNEITESKWNPTHINFI